MPKTASYALSEDDDFMVDSASDDDSDFDFDDIPPPALSKKNKTTTSKAKAKAAVPAKKKTTKKATSKAGGTKKSSAVTIDLDNDSDDENDNFNDESDELEFIDSAKNRPVLAERSLNSSEESEILSSSKSTKKKTIEQKYQKLSQLEHILVRPDTYSKSLSTAICLIVVCLLASLFVTLLAFGSIGYWEIESIIIHTN